MSSTVKKEYSSLDLYYKSQCYEVDFSKDYNFERGKVYSIRGNGTSLTAASFDKDCTVLQTNNSRKKLFELDLQNYLLEVSASSTIMEVYKRLTQEGLCLKAVPSYPMSTIGGCIAYNAHGQNHTRDGCFADHVVEMKIIHPSFGEMTLKNDRDKSIFDLTVNGFGVTGIIISVIIQVYVLPSNRLVVDRMPFKSLIDGYRYFNQKSKDYDYYHAWFDLNNISKNKQKGFIELASYEKNSFFCKEKLKDDYKEPHHSKIMLNIFGSFLMPIISKLYYWAKIIKKNEVIELFNFIHPSSDKLFYFSMCGKKGVIEHQILIPHNNVELYLEEFVDLLLKYRPIVPLCHTKIFNQKSRGMSFTGSGYCLTFHVPVNPNNIEMISEIDKLDIKYNCIANIIKDSRLTAEVIRLEYGQLFNDFKVDVMQYDPLRRFSSRIIRRLFEE